MIKKGDRVKFVGTKEEVEDCFGWSEDLDCLLKDNFVATVDDVKGMRGNPYVYIKFVEISGRGYGFPHSTFEKVK